MTVAAVCPTHGPQASSLISISNSSNVTMSNNSGFCSASGCRETTRTMEGTFNFRGGVVEVIAAPSWSVDALWAVASRAGEVIRLLADEDVSIDQAVRAARSIEPDLVRAVAGVPGEAVAEAVGEYTSATNPANGAAPNRNRVLKALVAVCGVLVFYGDLSSGATAAATDAATIIQWAVSHAQNLPEWFQEDVLPLLSPHDTPNRQP